MKQAHKNQSGFGILEGLLVAIVVAAIAFSGWAVYRHYKTHKVAPSTATSTKIHSSASSTSGHTTSQPANAYAGWETYTSTEAGYTIKYPSNWSLKTNVNNGGAENTLIISPNNFRIEALSFTKSSQYGASAFTANPSGNCEASCQTVNSTSLINIPKYGTLEIANTVAGVGDGTINELLLFPSASSIYILSPDKAGVYTTFSGMFQSQNQRQNTPLTSSQFAATTDVRTATLIYKSLSY